MVTAHTASAAPLGETSLEDPNAPIVIIGQVLCILVPLAVWFIPSPLESRSRSMHSRSSASWWWRGSRVPWTMR